MSALSRTIALTAAVALTAADSAMAAPGDLDPDFNTVGTVVTDVTFALASAKAAAVQADGKVVLVGDAYNGTDYDFGVARFNADGTLDSGFGGSGTASVLVPVGSGGDYGYAVAVQPDGKVLVAGVVVGDIGLARLNTDGSLDTSFGTDGKVVTDIGGSSDGANAIALQRDGKIVVAGYSFNGSDTDWAVVRYDSDGSLDTNFGGTGKVVTALATSGSKSDVVRAVAVQPDGKIIAAGYTTDTTEDFAVVRYNVDGSLDTGFSDDGKFVMAIGTFGDMAHSVAVQSDGKILVAGYTQNATSHLDMAVFRLSADGTLDTTFSDDDDGIVIADLSAGSDAATSIAVQPDQKVLVGGYANGADRDFALLRYNNDGTPDTGFGTGGAVLTNLSAGDDQANALAVQPDGKVVLAGTANGNRIALARHLVSESAWDLTPDTLGFTIQSDVTSGATITSETVTIAGLGVDIRVPLRISGGSYSLNDEAYVSDFAWVRNGDTLRVRHTASTLPSATTSTTLTIGGLAPMNNQALSLGASQKVTFSSVTVAAADNGGGGGGGTWDVAFAVLLTIGLKRRRRGTEHP